MRPITILQALSEARPEYLTVAQQPSTVDKLRYRNVLLGSIIIMKVGIAVYLVCKANHTRSDLTL